MIIKLKTNIILQLIKENRYEKDNNIIIYNNTHCNIFTHNCENCDDVTYYNTVAIDYKMYYDDIYTRSRISSYCNHQ